MVSGVGRCDGTIQEVDLAEDLMVDGETYDCIKSFCYLGDTLDGYYGVNLAATSRIRNRWMKFRELLPFLTSRAPPLEMKGRVYASCVRSSMTYGSDTRPLLVDVGLKFERAEMQMIRWMCGISLKDRRTNEELSRLVGVEIWLESVEADMAKHEIDKEDVHDRRKWRRNVNVMKRKSNPIGKRTINQ